MPLETGTLIAGRYEVIRTLRSGGMGALYEVRDVRRDGPPLALKEMLEGFTDPEERALIRRRFEEEARMLAALDHPGIPAIHDHFFREDSVCIVMEFIRGQDLEQELQDYLAFTHKPFPPEALVKDVLTVLEVLGYLHGQDPPVVHRDIKPANLIRDWRTGQVRLVDFGLARHVRSGGMTAQTLVGTLGYCPLEQMQGHSEPRSDLYALGATMHHLLSGQAPRFLDLSPLAAVVPEVDPRLAAVVDRATATDPASRFPDVASMAQALTAWLQARDREEGPPTEVVSVPEAPATEVWEMGVQEVDPARHPPAARRLVEVVLVLACVVLAWVLGSRLLGGSQAPEPRPAPSRPLAMVEGAATPSPAQTTEARVLPVPRLRPSPRVAVPPGVRPTTRATSAPVAPATPAPVAPAPRPSAAPALPANYPRAVRPAAPRAAPLPTVSAIPDTAEPEPEPEPVQELPSAPAPFTVSLDRQPDARIQEGRVADMTDPQRWLEVWKFPAPANVPIRAVIESAAAQVQARGWTLGEARARPSGVMAVALSRGDRRGTLLVGMLESPLDGRHAIVGLVDVPDGHRAAAWLRELEVAFIQGPRRPGP